jgi:hypothetical protein
MRKIILLLTFVLSTFKTYAELATDQQANPSSNNSIESFTIEGSYTPVYLKKEMIKRQVDFYSTFSGMLDDSQKEFSIRCRKFTPTGSHIVRRKCQSVYMAIIEARITQRQLADSLNKLSTPNSDNKYAGAKYSSSFSYTYNREGFDNIINKKYTAQMELVEQLLTEKPELREKLQQYINAKVLFQNALSKKEGNL